jgi:hypothetical protein
MAVDMEPFMSRNGLAAMQLSRQILALPVGGQLPRARDIAVELGFGNGTVQAGLQLLERVGAISTTSHGRLGTTLDAADRALLWELGGMQTLTMSMPLPYSRRYEGLASGFLSAFKDFGIPFDLLYQRGSKGRLNALVQGSIDIAVTSGLAFDLQRDELPVLELADLGPASYVGAHGIVLAQGKELSTPGLRVAIDRASADQTHLVESVFGDRDVTFVDTFYSQLDDEFASGRIDATVWNVDEIDQHLHAAVTVQELPGADRSTHAVLSVREGGTRVPRALFDDLDLGLVHTVLDDVLAGRRFPAY